MTEVLGSGADYARSCELADACIENCPNALKFMQVYENPDPAISKFGQESIAALAGLAKARNCAPKKYTDRDAVNDEHTCTAVGLGIR